MWQVDTSLGWMSLKWFFWTFLVGNFYTQRQQCCEWRECVVNVPPQWGKCIQANSNECDCPAETDCVLDEQRKMDKSEKLFNSARSMDDLKRWKYGLESNCTLCGNVFNSRMQIDRHEKTMHCGLPRHTCQLCSKGFMNKCQMNKHIEFFSKGKSRRKISADEFE